MLESLNSVALLLVGMLLGWVISNPRFREVFQNMDDHTVTYSLLGVGTAMASLLLGWLGLASVVVVYVLYIVFGKRESRLLNQLFQRDAAPIDSTPREPDDDVVVKLVRDWDATDSGDGATSEGIRELATERNVIVPPGTLDRLVSEGRLVKLPSGRYRDASFFDENTVAS